MTTNKITCIIFLIIGIIIFFISIYSIYKLIKTKESGYIIPGFIFWFVSIIFIISSLVHWKDDNIYKEIKCKKYIINTVIENIEKPDTIYIIKYKVK